jgi:hypothetical protein
MWACKATLAPQQFLIYYASPSHILSFLIHSPELSSHYQQRHIVAKQEKLGKEWLLNFAYEASFLSIGFFNTP